MSKISLEKRLTLRFNRDFCFLFLFILLLFLIEFTVNNMFICVIEHILIGTGSILALLDLKTLGTNYGVDKL